MNKREELREARRQLNKIYVEHDIKGFREFITQRAKEKPELTPFIQESDQVLSHLMYSMKSQLMYLGDEWQKSRNVLRMKQLWESSDKTCEELEQLPLCADCKFFRSAPSPKEDPCMHMGGSPGDIICHAFEALEGNFDS